MYTCPQCNGLSEVKQECPSCKEQMEDKGRLVDYMGDYIAYLEYEGTNLIDGQIDSTSMHTCIHLLYCSHCDEQVHLPVQEIKQ